MSALRILSIAALLGLCGCRSEKVNAAEADLALPAEVDFGTAFVGHRDVASLELRNTGRRALELTFELAAPFDAPGPRTLAGGETLTIELGLLAEAPGPLYGALFVRVGEGVHELPVRARAVLPPDCPARDCVSVSFNPATGACDEAFLPDGVACGATNRCLFDGVCVAGQCMGQARDCDDGNRCPTDACNAATGCVHEAVTCPASPRACEVAVCEPTTGCGSAPAEEGAACGPNDCTTAQVCINAECVSRPAPEGSECAPASACQGPGVCRAGGCQRPTPGLLSPRWRYRPAAGSVLSFGGHVDDDGNLYVTETGSEGSNVSGGGRDSNEFGGGAPRPPGKPVYLLSVSPAGQVRFRVHVTEDCETCSTTLAFTLDSSTRTLFFNLRGQTQARSMDDGRLLWTIDPSAGVPVYEPRPDGGPSYSLSRPLLVGPDAVAVPVMEGISVHRSHVRLFSRQNGALLASTMRDGHLYGVSAAGDGRLWVSSAACWAAVERVERLDARGQVLTTRLDTWITTITGEDDAYGYRSGELHHLGAGMHISPLDWLTGPLGGGVQLRVQGQQLFVWDPDARRLQRIDRSAGARRWERRDVEGAAPDFELLSNGGVAWTSRELDGGALLGAIDANGLPALLCRLDGADSPTAIIKGRAVVQVGEELRSYDVPGLDVAPHGWVARDGSLQRGNAAR